jgi:hypothetical protein
MLICNEQAARDSNLQYVSLYKRDLPEPVALLQ